MNYLKLFLFVSFIFCAHIANAENYIVEVPTLNIRSCAGTNCEIIGKLTEGNIVKPIQDFGEWLEIETENGSGYVIKRAITKKDLTKELDSSFASIFILLLVIGVIVFIYMLPSKLASGNKNAKKVFYVNIFLGWIPIIWIILLVAALIGEAKEQ